MASPHSHDADMPDITDLPDMAGVPHINHINGMPDLPDPSHPYFNTVLNQPNGLPHYTTLNLPSDPQELSSFAPEVTSDSPTPTIDSDLPGPQNLPRMAFAPQIGFAPQMSGSITERRPRKRQKTSHPMSDDDFGASQKPLETTEKPRTRLTRRGAATKTYQEPESDADFEESSPVIPSTRRGRPKRGTKKEDPEFLLQDPSSALVSANVAAILKDPRAWSTLLPAQQLELTKLYPVEPLTLGPPIQLPQHSGGMLTVPRTVPQAVMLNTALQSDIALFKEDLECGRLNPQWQQEGAAAMESRARGDFDDWKEQESESFWGQQQKLPYEVLAGESSSVRFDTLVAAGKFRVGDVWTYRRGFGKGAQSFAVDKEATIVSITPDNNIIFTFPPGTHKFSSVYNGQDITSEPISGPQPLADALIRTDGRNVTWRNVNAWKEFRCSRSNQDMGSLWEIRELYFVHEASK